MKRIFLILTMGIFLISLTSATVSTENLIAYWSFNETTGSTADDTHLHNYEGALLNMENGDWVAGKIGNGLNFDGINELVNVTNKSDFASLSQVTISFWVNTTTQPTGRTLLNMKGNAAGSDGIIIQRSGAGIYNFNIETTTGSDSNFGSATDNAWHHVVARWDGSYSSIWIDGIQEDIEARSGSLNPTSYLSFGCRDDGISCSNMTLDELGIWERNLSNDEIAELYNGGNGLGYNGFDYNGIDWRDGLDRYYAFNQTSGTNVPDYSGHGNDGTSVNSPAWVSGVLNNSLNFEETSTQYVSIPNFTIGSSNSINLWFNLSSGFADIGIFGSNGDADTYVYFPNSTGLYIQPDSGGLLLYKIPTIALNGWNMLTLATSSGNLRVYLNGTESVDGSQALNGQFSINQIARYAAGSDFWDGRLDEISMWNRTLSQNDINDLYNSGAGLPLSFLTILLNNPENNIIEINNSLNFSATINPSLDTSLLNSTIRLWYHNGTLFNESTNALSGTAEVQTDFNISLAIGNYTWNIEACESGDCVFSSNRSLNITRFKVNNEIWNNQTTGGSIETFRINISLRDALETNIGELIYNNTRYTGTILDLGSSQFQISRTITTPTGGIAENKTFYWNLTFSDNSNRFTTSHNQSVSPFLIDDCSTYSKVLLNFTMFDEESLQAINGTINLNVNFYTNNTNNLVGSYNRSIMYEVEQESLVCLQNITTDYQMSYEIEHKVNSSYFIKYRNVQKVIVNNDTSTQNVILYNLLQSSGKTFKIIVFGNLFGETGNRDLLIEVQRKYPQFNHFRLIESPITSAEGETTANLVESDVIYNFIISYNNEVIGTFNNYQVKCANPTTEQCSLILNLGESTGGLEDFENYGNISSIFLFDRDAHELTHTFTSTDGQVHTVRSEVVEATGFLNNSICDDTLTGTSGTFNCALPTIYHNSSFYVQITVDGKYVGSKYFTQGVTINWFGADIFIELLMFSSLVLLFIAHPITIILGAILGIIMPFLFVYMAQASFGSILATIIYYVIAGIIVIVQIRRKI